MSIKDIINEECIAFATEKPMSDIQFAEYFKENVLPDDVDIIHNDGNYFKVSVKGKTYSCNIYNDDTFYHPIAKFKLLKN